jgi:hypothetical protein
MVVVVFLFFVGLCKVFFALVQNLQPFQKNTYPREGLKELQEGQGQVSSH